MKKSFLTILLSVMAFTYVNAQNYFIAVVNYTDIGHEFGAEIVEDCEQTAGCSGEVQASNLTNSAGQYNGNEPVTTYLPVVNYAGDLPNSSVAWASAIAMCPGELSAIYVNNALGCVDQSSQIGNATCIGDYRLIPSSLNPQNNTGGVLLATFLIK